MMDYIKKTAVLLTAVMATWSFFLPGSHGSRVDWRINKTIHLQETPIDFTISRSGKYTFVLTDAGDIMIYNAVGAVSGKIAVGRHIDKILAGPNDNSLLVCSRGNKTTEVISFVIEQQINTVGSPFKGRQEAPVEVVVFSDFQCPHCARMADLLEDVYAMNKDHIKIVYKNFPLTSIHKQAVIAARAALAAMESGKFWEFHDRLYEQFDTISEKSILKIAVDLGFDKNDFQEKMKAPRITLMIQKDIQDAKKANVKGIPTVFINGKLQQKKTFADMQRHIDRELTRQGQ